MSDESQVKIRRDLATPWWPVGATYYPERDSWRVLCAEWTEDGFEFFVTTVADPPLAIDLEAEHAPR